jgi:hypothetical protein
MKNMYRLSLHYDSERLLVDLHAAEQAARYQMHWAEKYYEGVWDAIPLMSHGGRTDADSLKHQRGDYAKTEVVAHCPYFEEIIDSFKCSKQRVRLLRLESGAKIHKHRDPRQTWAMGVARLHIPIVTHSEIYFFVDGQRVVMQPGEVWYCDFSRFHWLENRGPIARVHLVLDLVINDWLRRQFPQETAMERLSNWTYRHRLRGAKVLRKKVVAVRRRLGLIRQQ